MTTTDTFIFIHVLFKNSLGSEIILGSISKVGKPQENYLGPVVQ